jgi:hypothetical protein
MPIAVPPQLKRVPSIQRLLSTLSQLFVPEHKPLSMNPEAPSHQADFDVDQAYAGLAAP